MRRATRWVGQKNRERGGERAQDLPNTFIRNYMIHVAHHSDDECQRKEAAHAGRSMEFKPLGITVACTDNHQGKDEEVEAVGASVPPDGALLLLLDEP